jgi:hypothetical protein
MVEWDERGSVFSDIEKLEDPALEDLGSIYIGWRLG